jgi:hypothetical protein
MRVCSSCSSCVPGACGGSPHYVLSVSFVFCFLRRVAGSIWVVTLGDSGPVNGLCLFVSRWEAEQRALSDTEGVSDKPLKAAMNPFDVSCAHCGKVPTAGVELKRCSRCKGPYYCSTDCQKAHWPAHKGVRCIVIRLPASRVTRCAVPGVQTSPTVCGRSTLLGGSRKHVHV